jgi:hypothetical protein
MSGEISRIALRNLWETHHEDGAIPLKAIEDLLRRPSPIKKKSEDGLYVVRLYDYYEHRWINCSKSLSWEKALEYWAKETDNGMKMACFEDHDYYDIYPADTCMIVNSLSD